jgi:Mg2+ and Co2+ transporter CorA
VRPDASQRSLSSYKVPHPLIQAFGCIFIYLICVLKATQSTRVDGDSIQYAVDLLNRLLGEAEIAFIRMRTNTAVDDDYFDDAESISTTETLLAMLIENAFSISDPEAENQKPAPYFDLRYVYSRYTAEATENATQHADSRHHKDLKLLAEEIGVIQTILSKQRETLKELFPTQDMHVSARESPMSTLDMRVGSRALADLQTRIDHFTQLGRLAEQASEWNQHFIDVRNEANGKAIFIFTTFTIIFLPLTFVAGLLGMNTKDIRNTEDNQWIFWAVALPFTVAVLVVAVGIVQFISHRRGRLLGRRRRWRLFSPRKKRALMTMLRGG